MSLQSIASWLQSSRCAVAFTGAGISTESGIPDFRSPGGVWATNRQILFDEFLASSDARREYWRQKSIAHREFSDSQPNAGHVVLSKWSQAGLLRGVITQNIDELHQIAGSPDVLELHGTARKIACLDCGARSEADPLVAAFLETDQIPDCEQCGGRLKHATISFGQQLDPQVLETASRWCQEADLFFAIGSSLVVEPAASLPRHAKAHGARLVIINRDPTDQDASADEVIHASIGETLSAIDELLTTQMTNNK